MIVIVAEKPSVGRDIAHVLGCSQSGEGCITGDKYTVTWALGHLVTLCEPDEIDEKYKKWRMDDLPMLPDVLPTKIIAKTRKQFTVVKKLINDKATERVICATDAGREGELIFYYIYTQAKCQKPVDRLWISSMTDEAIRLIEEEGKKEEVMQCLLDKIMYYLNKRAAGKMEIELLFLRIWPVTTSNSLILSISSPKNSIIKPFGLS